MHFASATVPGNKTLTKFVGWLFGHRFSDILSGYRAFSRRFVKSFPALASGFEIETELTIHALELKMPVGEIEATYAARPKGSRSKLSTWRDGLRIFATIIFLFKEVRPARFFGAIFAVLALVSLALTLPLMVTYFQTGLVPAPSDSHYGNRYYAPGIYIRHMRYYPRYGKQGPARGQADDLSLHARSWPLGTHKLIHRIQPP